MPLGAEHQADAADVDRRRRWRVGVRLVIALTITALIVASVIYMAAGMPGMDHGSPFSDRRYVPATPVSGGASALRVVEDDVAGGDDVVVAAAVVVVT